MFAIVLGVPLALYAFLTRGRRRAMRAIREGAAAQGWRFRIRHWLGDPTAFRVDGLTRNGLRWILKTRGASENDRGWAVQMGLRVPDLAGQIDFAILPRDARDSRSVLLVSGVSPAFQQRIAGFSGTLASAIEFFREAREFPTGIDGFRFRLSRAGESKEDSRSADGSFCGRENPQMARGSDSASCGADLARSFWTAFGGTSAADNGQTGPR